MAGATVARLPVLSIADVLCAKAAGDADLISYASLLCLRQTQLCTTIIVSSQLALQQLAAHMEARGHEHSWLLVHGANRLVIASGHGFLRDVDACTSEVDPDEPIYFLDGDSCSDLLTAVRARFGRTCYLELLPRGHQRHLASTFDSSRVSQTEIRSLRELLWRIRHDEPFIHTAEEETWPH